MNRLRVLLVGVCLVCACPLVAQVLGPAPFTRVLSDVLQEVEHRFEVSISCKKFVADTVTLTYADSRMRPYSLQETLDNICRPLDLKWSGEQKITLQPYEYHRRTPADGVKLLAWLSAQYDNQTAWEQRAEQQYRMATFARMGGCGR